VVPALGVVLAEVTKLGWIVGVNEEKLHAARPQAATAMLV
jgi:hypothetical protein